jgi:hypothetical protein
MKKEIPPVTREQLLSILSDDEAARVKTAETAAQLAVGDEFIDLSQLELGVVRAGESRPKQDVLSRKGVNEHTWLKVVTNLNARQFKPQVAPPVPRKGS